MLGEPGDILNYIYAKKGYNFATSRWIVRNTTSHAGMIPDTIRRSTGYQIRYDVVARNKTAVPGRSQPCSPWPTVSTTSAQPHPVQFSLKFSLSTASCSTEPPPKVMMRAVLPKTHVLAMNSVGCTQQYNSVSSVTHWAVCACVRVWVCVGVGVWVCA